MSLETLTASGSRRYHTVLFDLDGTLIDSIPIIVESLAHALNHHLGWSPPPEILVLGVGTPLMEQLRMHAAKVTERQDLAFIEEIRDTYIAHNLAGHDASVKAYPEVASTLAALQGRGVRLGIVTSKPHGTARRGLRLCEIEDPFEVVVGSDDVTRHKPDPEPVHAALSALGVAAEGTLFVGDSPHDITSGCTAGVHTGAAAWGPFDHDILRAAHPTRWLASPKDVLALV